MKDIEPLFPFGFGLSYTEFEYSTMERTNIAKDGTFTITFEVKNIGDVAGREVVQIYVQDLQASLPRPHKELKGFVKLDLAPGETKKVVHVFDREALGFYDERTACWVAESGEFDIQVAASSANIRMTYRVDLKETFTWTGL